METGAGHFCSRGDPAGRPYFESAHQAVLCREVLSFLTEGFPSYKGLPVFIDGTAGEGGHTTALLEATAPQGRVIAFDRDPEAIHRLRERLGARNERLTLVNDSYENLSVRLPDLLAGSKAPVLGILLDLGLSSRQLGLAERGFSFQKEGPLDMRFNQEEKGTAGDIVNRWPEDKLRALFEDNDETWGKKIASAIVAERRRRPIQSTTELAQIIQRCIPSKFHSRRLDPATKCFQALRIATNDEMGGLKRFLSKLPELMRHYCEPGARAAIISFHSTEDRLVKNCFREGARNGFFEVLTPKPVMAGDAEVAQNPRARSAKLRVAALQSMQKEPF